MNVIVICVDTLRWDHVGYNGRLPIQTKNIDRLAERCAIFDRCIISSFPTNPMRVDCFTGNCNFPRYGWQRMPEYETVMGEVMGEAGYYTALIHDHTPMFGIVEAFDEVHRTFSPPENTPDPDDVPCLCPKENFREMGRFRQKHMAELAHAAHERDFWIPGCMQKAVDWLEDNAGREKWLLWLDTWEPHEVWHTPEHYLNLYDPGYEGVDYNAPNYGYTDVYTAAELKHLQAHYAAEVTMTDRWTGYFLDQLDLMQLWDDTMLVFISDHGTHLGDHSRMGKHTLLADKDPWPMYEEVTHVPLLVWIPRQHGHNPNRISALAQPPDLTATIYEACGIPAPEIYGKSWIPLLDGSRRQNWGQVYSSTHCGPGPTHPQYPSRLTVTTEQWTYVAEETGWKPELYDIRNDPAQSRDLADTEPDTVARLQAEVVDFMREQDAADQYVQRFL